MHRLAPKLFPLLRPLHFRFSTSSPAPQLTDYEYTNRIHQSLQHNDINQALRLLVNSHLDNKVLDMHIYRNYFKKVNKLQLNISYEEIAYILYREYFKPNMLMIDWMNSLAKSKSQRIRKLLVADFAMLDVQMPANNQTKQKDNDSHILNKYKNKTDPKQQKQAQQKPQTPTKPPKQCPPSPPSPSSSPQPYPPSQNLQNLNKQGISMQLQQSIKGLMKPLLSLIPLANTKISIHNIQIEYEHEEDEDEEGHKQEMYTSNAGSLNKSGDTSRNMDLYEDQHESEEIQDGNQDDIEESYLEGQDLWIKKIKIGKIQINISGNNNNFNNDNDNNNTKQ